VTSLDEELLGDLLLLWEEFREQGVDTPAHQLAPDRPELVPELDRRIRLLKASAWLDKPVDSEPTNNASTGWVAAGQVHRSPRAEASPPAVDYPRPTPRDGLGRARLITLCLCALAGLAVSLAALRYLERGVSKSQAKADSMATLIATAETEFFHARYADAESTLSRILVAAPDNYRALVDRGICRLKLGKLESAIQDFTAALGQQPTSSEALQQRAQASVYLRRYDDAIADLERVVAATGHGSDRIRRQLQAVRAARDKAVDAGDSPDNTSR